MSNIGVGELRGRIANEDLSSHQYRFVVILSTGKIEAADAITDKAYGVLQNDAVTSGLEGSVKVQGETLVVAAEALSVGDFVAPDADGKAQVAVATQYPRGIVVEAASAEDELAVIELFYHADDLGGTETFVAGVIQGTLSVGDDLTMADEADFVLNTTTGSMLPKTSSQKLGFWGTTPVAQQSHIADPAATASDPDALTAATLTDNGGGAAADGTIADIANADASETTDRSVIADAVKELSDQINKLVADVTSIRTQLVATIDDVQANNTAIDSINALCATLGLTASS